MCVCERDRQTETDTLRQMNGKMDRQTDRHRERERERERIVNVG